MNTLLSAVIITYNEEKNIARCLDSLAGVADEIVVLDSFSTDATQKICLEKNVVFRQHTFDGHISQKNRALGLATHRRVLSLDADEALSPELKAEIIKLKNAGFAHEAYEMNRLTNYCGQWIKGCGWYPDKKTRLFDRSKGQWTGLNPHDRFEVTPGASVGFLKGDLLHYSYYSIRQHINQVNYFTDLLAQSMWERGKKGTMLKIIFSPVYKFIHDYLLKKGFADGYYGWAISIISAHATFLKYVKLRELNKGKR